MKKKRIISRKKRAVRLIVLCLTLLIAYLAIDPYGYGFSKETAVAETCDYFAVGEAEILPLTDVNPEPAADGFPTLFAVNDNCMMHIMLNHTPLHGWQRWGTAVLDCTEEAPLHAGVHITEEHGADINSAIYFGRIYDGRISSVKLEITYNDCYDEPTVIQTGYIASTDLGRFFCIDEPFPSKYPGINKVIVSAYNSNEELIYSTEIISTTHTSYG